MSEQVQKLQADLNALGATPELLEDGIYGYATRQAVLAFQGREGIDVDGVAGKKTLAQIAMRLETGSKPQVRDKKIRIICVYGKLGNRPFGFSLGLSDLADELNLIPGVHATCDDYGMFYTNADDHAMALKAALAGTYTHIGVIGHSMGADSAAKTSWLLDGMGVSVDLLGPVDPTPFGCPTIPDNVRECYSFANTVPLQLGGYSIQPSSEFVGIHKHWNLAIPHTAIDDAHKEVHQVYIDAVRKMMA